MLKRLKWPFSLMVLALVLLLFEPARILAEVHALHPGWLAVALSLTALQTGLSAWRWRFTADRLGLDLPWPRALGDYYLATFANQTLPGGVLGDAWRAQRHAGRQRQTQQHCQQDDAGSKGAAWRAVLIERGSGQVLVVFLSVLSLVLLTQWHGVLRPLYAAPGPLATLLGAVALMATLLCGLAALTRRFWRPHWKRFRTDLKRSMTGDAWLAQSASSLLIVLSYAAVFMLAARAIGVELSPLVLLCLALPVLLAMLIPLSIGGWGWREAMAGGLWLSLGLPPEQGVAVSISYGVIVFLGSTPGLLVWLTRPDRPPPDPQSKADQSAARRSTSTTSSSPRG